MEEMTKYYATSWGSMLVGEEVVLKRLHLDTPLSNSYEAATARREVFIYLKIAALKQDLDRVSMGLPLYEMDEQNRFTIASKEQTPHDAEV